MASDARPRTVAPPAHYEATEITTIVRAVLRAMGATLKNLFRKPITVHYPDKPRQYPSRYRGLLALTYDKETGEENCIGCRLCEYVCPPGPVTWTPPTYRPPWTPPAPVPPTPAAP